MAHIDLGTDKARGAMRGSACWPASGVLAPFLARPSTRTSSGRLREGQVLVRATQHKFGHRLACALIPLPAPLRRHGKPLMRIPVCWSANQARDGRVSSGTESRAGPHTGIRVRS